MRFTVGLYNLGWCFVRNPDHIIPMQTKVAFALSYMAGVAQNWAMPFLHAFDEGREHELLQDYDAFQEAIIGIYGDLD